MLQSLLQRMAALRAGQPPARRRVIDEVLQDPGRTLDESFEALAERCGSSVPTIMRTCRALGFDGLREFKLALARDIALGGSPLHRRVSLDNTTDEVVGNIVASAAGSVLRVREQLDTAVLDTIASMLANAAHIDVYGVGATSWFMANDLQARLFRLGLSANAWADYHFQQVAAGAQRRGTVAVAISYVGGMPTLLDTVDVVRNQGASVVAITRAGTPLAERADLVLAIDVPEDTVMRVGVDATLAHFVVIEILSVLVAKQLGMPAVERLQKVRAALQRHGIDVAHHPIPVWPRSGAEEEVVN